MAPELLITTTKVLLYRPSKSSITFKLDQNKNKNYFEIKIYFIKLSNFYYPDRLCMIEQY
jgi:hypothetical protein